MAGDIYSAPPYVGRGGWSWYTGSAAWMHRAALEHLFGMRQRGNEVSFTPCLPSHWDDAELALTQHGRTLRVLFCRADATDALDRARRAGAVGHAAGAPWCWDDASAPECLLLQLDATRRRPTPAGASIRWATDEGLPRVGTSSIR